MDKAKFKRILGYLTSLRFYKSQLIANKSLRKLIPAKWYISIQYEILMGEHLNLKHPKRLNEKLQWLKLYDRKPIYTTLVDKLAVKPYLAQRYGDEYIIPTYGSWESADEIDFSSLPNKFVLKCNHNCAEGLCICKDKNQLPIEPVKEKLNRALTKNFYWQCREWPYKNIKPMILAEKLLETKDGKLPNDYKLHFINGKFQFVYVSFDRQGINDRCVYDRNWERLPFTWTRDNNRQMNFSEVPQPSTFEKMVQIGTEIAKDFRYVRVDFYDVDGKLYFGEITLFHGAGYDFFTPDKYDFFYGEKLKLN